MRLIPLFLCTFCLFLSFDVQAKSAMNRCFENYGSNEALMFSCMSKGYEKREEARKTIEADIINIVNKNRSDNYSAVQKEKDIDNLIEGREMFEAYRKLECNRQKTFLRRHGLQATFEYMVCLYDMTTQRIRTLQNSVKE